MAVCKFWLQGHCRNGDSCRFEHPRNSGGRQDNNRFAPLNDNRSDHRSDNRNYHHNNSRTFQNDSRNQGGNPRDPPRQHHSNQRHDIDREQVKKDLSEDRPEWILSCYSPNPHLPKQLFGGTEREISREEVRLRHYEAVAMGQSHEQASVEAQKLYDAAMTQIKNVLQDVYGAVKYLQNGYSEHPNRNDICDEISKTGIYTPTGAPTTSTSTGNTAFGQSANTNNSTPFGQPSATITASAFGAPSLGSPFMATKQATAFGQQSGGSAFGQPLSSGQPSGFGKPSAFTQASTFGATSAPGQSSAFGAPSTIGQQSAFGQPSSLGSRPGFGQSTALGAQPTFGQIPTLGTPFGQPSFGQSSQPFGSTSATSMNPFSQPISTSGFGQVNADSVQSTADSAMDLSSPQKAPLGASTFPSSQSTGFGQINNGPFGQPSNNAFTAQSNSTLEGSALTQPVSGFGQINGTSNAFGVPLQTQGQGGQGIGSGGPHGSKWAGKQIRQIDGQPCYQDYRGNWQRIWFKDGPPAWKKEEILPHDIPYDAEMEQRFQFAKQNGVYQDGIIPLNPPKREWTNWDF